MKRTFHPLKWIWSILYNSTWFGLFPFPSPKGPFPYTHDSKDFPNQERPFGSSSSFVPKALLNYRRRNWGDDRYDFIPDEDSLPLFNSDGPILSHHYFGHDIYRFHHYGAFGPTSIFILEHGIDKITLSGRHIIWGDFFDSKNPNAIITPTIETKCERELSKEEWNHFLTLIHIWGFWNLPPLNEGLGLDGAEWEMEGHIKEGYWYVTRWCPQGAFEQCGRYFFELCGFPQPSC